MVQNKFLKIKKTKGVIDKLKSKNYTQLRSAIYNKESAEMIIIKTTDKTFFVCCEDGLKKSEELIEVAFEKKAININNIEELCQQI